jgi:hypothetical protein
MEKEFVPYEPALELKQLGFAEPCFNRFYTKPNSKMFGIDDKGRHYPIKNTAKKLYTIGEHFVLKDDNVISAPLYQQAFKFFRKKYNLFGCIDLHVSNPTHWYIRIDDMIENDYIYHSEDNDLKFKSPEEAELACINKLIEIAKKIKQ